MTAGRDEISCFGRLNPAQKARTGNSNLELQAGIWSNNFLLYIVFRGWNLRTKYLSGFSSDLPPANLGKGFYYNEVDNPRQKIKLSIHMLETKGTATVLLWQQEQWWCVVTGLFTLLRCELTRPQGGRSIITFITWISVTPTDVLLSCYR